MIEGRLHRCLDVSLQEDRSRVRTPNAALVLGMIRRVVLSLSNAAVDQARKENPKTKFNTKSFRQRFLSARGGRERPLGSAKDKGWYSISETGMRFWSCVVKVNNAF